MALSFDTDDARELGPRLGLVLLQTDESMEIEFRDIARDIPFVLHHSRVPCAADINPETLAAMETEIPDAVRLLPLEVHYDSIGYGCTSGSTVIGESRVQDLIHSAYPDVATSNPLTAIKAALNALEVRRLGFLTPYVPSVSQAMRSALEDVGIEIVAFGSYEEPHDHVVAQITPASTLAAMKEVAWSAPKDKPCEAIFAACTNLRCLPIIKEAEEQLGIPVLSSNQAMAWHMLRCAGIQDRATQFGQLFEKDIT